MQIDFTHLARRSGVAATIAVLLAATPVMAQAPQVTGVWIDDTGDGAIEFGACDGDRLCGRVVWLKEPVDKAGKPIADGANPKIALRQQPVCGLQVIGSLRRAGASTWGEGWVYDPKDGKSYDLEVKLQGADKLQVTGYLGIKLLGETFVWTRAPANLARCDTSQAASNTPATGSKATGSKAPAKAATTR